MKTIVVTLDKEHPDGEAILRAGEIIKAGGLVAFPTETVYGLGGDALNPESSRKIYAAKGRPSDNPLIVHICRWEDIYKIADPVPEIAQRLAARFWPGPLTMILNKTALVPKETTGGLDTVAVRFPSDSIAQRFICRCPLIALSDLVQHFTADSSFVLLCLHREEGGTQNKQLSLIHI